MKIQSKGLSYSKENLGEASLGGFEFILDRDKLLLNDKAEMWGSGCGFFHGSLHYEVEE